MSMAFWTTVASCSRGGEQERVDGARLYESACARCHGPRGEGGVTARPGDPAPRDLTDPLWQSSRSDEELVATVLAGRGTMPSFLDVLEPGEVVEVVGYLRTLAAPSSVEGAAATGGAR